MSTENIVVETRQHLSRIEVTTAIRVQSFVRTVLGEFFKRRGYVEIPPVIISPLTDPLNHPVSDPSIDYYGYPYTLTKSMIFHKHIVVQYLNKIFAFSPNIRLETIDKIGTGRHLTEFTQFDLEKKNGTRSELIALIEEFFVELVKKVNLKFSEELKMLKRELKTPHIPFKQIKYIDAETEYGADFEMKLSTNMSEPFWIIDIPLKHREFYDREDPTQPGILVDMDLYYPEGFGEALSGGEREYEYEKIQERIVKKGQSIQQFYWYLEFAKMGLAPSAGFGIGIERLSRYICGIYHIEDTHPFPKLPGRFSI